MSSDTNCGLFYIKMGRCATYKRERENFPKWTKCEEKEKHKSTRGTQPQVVIMKEKKWIWILFLFLTIMILYTVT